MKVPSASLGFGNGLVEGGIAAPLEAEGPGDFGLGLVARIGLVGDDEGQYRPAFLFTGTRSGLSYAVVDEIVLEAGGRVGLSPAAQDLAIFLGPSVHL